MNDLISRQAVLDVITASINQFGGRYTTDMLNMWGLFTQMIQEMPSAQPEIIRCKDCKHYDPNDHCYLQGAEADDFCSYAERRE